jgi:hypothetical protein
MLLWLIVRLMPPSSASAGPSCRTMGLVLDVGSNVICLVTLTDEPSTGLIGDGPREVMVPLPVTTTLLVSTLSSGGEIATVDAHGSVTLGASPSAHSQGTIGISTHV